MSLFFGISGGAVSFVLASPFIIAYGIALVIEKPVNALAKVFRGKKALASTLIVTGLTIIIAAAVLYYMAGCGRN